MSKQDMELILDGGIPARPPHWELDFFIEDEMFGMDSGAVAEDDMFDFRLGVFERLVDELGWAAVRGGRDPESVGRMKASLGDRALIAAYDSEGVFWMPTGGDMMDFVVSLYEKGDALHAEARRKCDGARDYCAKCVDAGADFFVLTYDFGFNDGPFISPDQFGEFVVPYMTEIVGCIHDMGKKALLHSDGCLNQILGAIHSTGIDGYQSVDPQGHMDIRAVREEYPDWILMGNVACNMMQDTDEADIRKSVRYCMTHGGVGKPYIFSTSNCIFAGMPAESYRIMLDEYLSITG